MGPELEAQDPAEARINPALRALAVHDIGPHSAHEFGHFAEGRDIRDMRVAMHGQAVQAELQMGFQFSEEGVAPHPAGG